MKWLYKDIFAAAPQEGIGLQILCVQFHQSAAEIPREDLGLFAVHGCQTGKNPGIILRLQELNALIFQRFPGGRVYKIGNFYGVDIFFCGFQNDDLALGSSGIQMASGVAHEKIVLCFPAIFVPADHFFSMISIPPRYLRRTSGTTIEPSAR